MALSSRLMCLAVLVLASHVMLSSAAVLVWGLRATGLTGDALSASDPYVKVWCGGIGGGQTEAIQNTPNPSWGAEFSFSDCSTWEILRLEVWDQDVYFDDLLFTCIALVKPGTYTNECASPYYGTVYFKYHAQ